MTLAVAPEDLQPQVSFIMNGNHTLPVRLTAPVPVAELGAVPRTSRLDGK